MNALPQELIDTVIDYHFHDRPTLVTCSLVCKAWLPSSRYHLFHTVKLGDENWNTFLDFLQDQAFILPNKNKFTPIASLKNRGDDNHRLLQILPSSAFYAVHVLEVDGSQFAGPSSRLAHLISSFPQLHSFTWTPRRSLRSRIPQPQAVPKIDSPWPVQLKLPWHFHTIDIAGNCDEIQGFLDGFNGLRHPPRLSTVRINYACARNIDSIGELLRIQGHSLRHLELSWSYYGSSASFGDLDFSKSTGLQSLAIDALRGITAYVRYVRSCLLHTPIQELFISANMHIHEKTAWADLDDTIVRSLEGFPRPNFVLSVMLRPYATRQQSELFVKTTLPGCARLGVVRCDRGGDSEGRPKFGRRTKSGTLSWDRCYSTEYSF